MRVADILKTKGSAIKTIEPGATIRALSASLEFEAVGAIRNPHSLESYHYYHAALGEFELRLNHHPAAAAHFRKAVQLAEIKSEKIFLTRQLESCEVAEPKL